MYSQIIRPGHNGLPDDIAITDVSLFRLERMSSGHWWCAAYRGEERVTFEITSKSTIRVAVTEDDLGCRDDSDDPIEPAGWAILYAEDLDAETERHSGASPDRIEAAAKRFHLLSETNPEAYRPFEHLGKREQAVMLDWADDIMSAAVPVSDCVVTREDLRAILDDYARLEGSVADEWGEDAISRQSAAYDRLRAVISPFTALLAKPDRA